MSDNLNLEIKLVDGTIFRERNIKGILFDLDGTLISTLDLHIESFQWILNKLGKEVHRKDLEKLMGLTPQDIIKRFLQGIDEESLWEASVEKENYLETLIKHVTPFSGVEVFLQNLKANNIQTAVISSTHLKLVKILLRSAKLLDYFDAIISGDEITHGKPNPEPFQKGLDKLGINAESGIGIGDSIFDSESSLRAGMRFIGVLTGKTTQEEFKKFNGIHLIKSMNDLSLSIH